MIIVPGAVSQSLIIQIVNDSNVGVTGLVAATFPVVYYARAGAAAVAITLVDLAAIASVWSSGGVKEYSGGYYRLDIPNALQATPTIARIFGEASGQHLRSEYITVAYFANVVPYLLATVVGSPSTTSVQVSGLTKQNANAYRSGFPLWELGAANYSEPGPRITSSVYDSNTTYTTLTFAVGSPLLVTPVVGDQLIIVGSVR